MLTSLSSADPDNPITEATITCADCRRSATVTTPGYPSDAALRRIFYSEHGWAVRKRPALKPEDLCRTCSLDLAVAVTGEYIRQLINRETGLAVADHQTKHEGVHCRDPEPGYAATVVLVVTDRTERRKIATAITETLTAARCVFTGVPGSVVRWRVTGRVP